MTGDVFVSPEKYSTEVFAMLRSFYPESRLNVFVPESRKEDIENTEKDGWFCKVSVSGSDGGLKADTEIEGENRTFEGSADDAQFKKEFGAWFYSLLSERTGKSLPWGNLSGVRPTKPALYGILKNESRETIEKYYRGEHFVSEEKTKLALDIAEKELRVLGKGFDKRYSIYIGIPFCPTRCLYCSFTSNPIAAYRNSVEDYLSCIRKEMACTASLLGKDPETVYIGGGTPTTLSAAQLDILLSDMEENFNMEGVTEFTVEAGRADSIDADKLKVLKDHRVSRISVNPQTMNQSTLDLIGRKGTPGEVIKAFNLARKIGFDNINMDIILGLPGESAREVAYTLDEIKKLRPDSLTVHSLAIKRASEMNRVLGEKGVGIFENSDETMRLATDAAREMNLEPYYLYRQKNMAGNLENVGFAREGAECVYNIKIIEELQSIAALGAGSISKKVERTTDDKGDISYLIKRCENVKDIKGYLERIDELCDRKAELFG